MCPKVPYGFPAIKHTAYYTETIAENLGVSYPVSCCAVNLIGLIYHGYIAMNLNIANGTCYRIDLKASPVWHLRGLVVDRRYVYIYMKPP